MVHKGCDKYDCFSHGKLLLWCVAAPDEPELLPFDIGIYDPELMVQCPTCPKDLIS